MKKWYKQCTYCGEEIRVIAKKCRFCWESLENEEEKGTKREYLEEITNKNRSRKNENENNSRKYKKIFRHYLDKSIIECNVCWYKGEWWRKTQWYLVDFLNYFFLWTLLHVILDTFKKELVICPDCWTSNVIEIECEKVWFFTKLWGLLLGVGIFVWIICLIWYLCS